MVTYLSSKKELQAVKLSAADIFNRLKTAYGFKYDRPLIDLLGAEQSAFSNWKRRDKIPYEEIITRCNISLNWLFRDQGPMFTTEETSTPADTTTEKEPTPAQVVEPSETYQGEVQKEEAQEDDNFSMVVTEFYDAETMRQFPPEEMVLRARIIELEKEVYALQIRLEQTEKLLTMIAKTETPEKQPEKQNQPKPTKKTEKEKEEIHA